MLKIQNIVKHFDGVKALDGLTLEIERGEITALIGPNGSGKTTLFSVISNLSRKNSGHIYLNKEETGKKEDYEI